MNDQGEVLLLPEADGDKTKYASAADLKQSRLKELMIEQLRKTPVIQICCEKLNISRSSYYRWRQEDKKFAEDCDKALEEGCELVNDLAESQLLGAIRDQNLTAVIFWLRNHHQKYKNKVEVTASLKNLDQPLTQEQQDVIDKALRLVAFPDDSAEPEKEVTYVNQPIKPSDGGGNPATGIVGEGQDRLPNQESLGQR